ncbi:DUF3122 domain-containing protein [Leptolyngbya iicbica]|nr:DUF3122 domain-containing protein [Leptolyngbya sp. LK]
MPTAQASVHVYRERPGQVTVRSRLSLRDLSDRAWQVIAFKRTQGTALQGYYLRLVGFPGAVEVDQQHPATVTAPTGQSRQLPWIVDPQAKTLPPNVGQFDLAPLLTELDQALPLEVQVPLLGMEPAEMAIAPFIVEEWLQVKRSDESPAPMGASSGE